MNDSINPVIVVVAYNRENCIRRLLSALAKAKYDDEVTLIISIDCGDNQNVIDIAEKFVWNHGKKIVRTFTENQGCREHVMQCIDYSIEYGAAIIFEDDILPSMNFYSYVKKTLQFYSCDQEVFAISLHNQAWNGFADKLFIPMRNEYDVYMAHRVVSWGECFIGEKWAQFKEWYAENANKLQIIDSLPQVIYRWEESWGKFVWNYIGEKNMYFVIPYDSLTTRFDDAGVHAANKEIKYKCQVPLMCDEKSYCLPEVREAIKYDAFFESIDLKNLMEERYGKRVVIDYYGTRSSYGDAQLCLTRKSLPFRILETYGDDMIQPELNYIYNIQGDDIALYDLEEPAEIRRRDENKNPIYFENHLRAVRETASKHFVIMEVFSQWMRILQQGKSISEYLKMNGITDVAIYGMGMLGERLFDELSNSDIMVVCGIDRDIKKHYRDLPITRINNIPGEVTYIIVTAIFYYQDIKDNLAQCTGAKIISLQDIIEELMDTIED